MDDMSDHDGCSEEHQQLQRTMHEIQKSLEFHIIETHGTLLEEHEIDARDDDLQDEIEELAAAVLGPRQSELAGGGRREKVGLVYQMGQILQWQESVDSRLRNGGIPAKLTAKDRAGVWVAVIAAGASAASAIIVSVIQN